MIGVYLLIEVIAQLVRLRIVATSIGLSLRRYIRYLLPLVGVVLLSCGVNWLIRNYIQGMDLWAIILRSASSVSLVLMSIFLVGLERNERGQIMGLIKTKIWKRTGKH